MSADLIFSICNLAILPGWALLIAFPRWKWTLGLIASGIIPFVLGLVYVGLIFSQAGDSVDGGGFGSLEALYLLFSNPYGLTAAWVHYVAFDLFVGATEVHDSQQKSISHWLVLPCLPLTLMLGPTGLVLYLVIRSIKTREVRIYSTA